MFLYGHSAGSDLHDILYKALKRGQSRWRDPNYLARIVFCQMMMDLGEGLDGLTGFGIGSRLCASQYPVIALNIDSGSVALMKDEEDGLWPIGKPVPFDGVVQAGDRTAKRNWKWLRKLTGAPPRDGEDD